MSIILVAIGIYFFDYSSIKPVYNLTYYDGGLSRRIANRFEQCASCSHQGRTLWYW